MLKPAGLYSHIQNNTLKSVLLLLCLPVLIELFMVFYRVPLAIGGDQLFGFVAQEIGATDFPITGFVEAVQRSFGERYDRGWWLFFFNCTLSFAVTYYFSRYILRAKTGAVPIERKSEPRLYNIVENLAITAGLPMPDLEIIEVEGMNAYASGMGPKNSVVTVTRGLLNGLDNNELAGVIAHELCHIKHHDARLMTFASTLVGVLTGIWAIVWRFVMFPTPLKVFIFLTMLPVAIYVLTGFALIGGAAMLGALAVRAMISHAREFMADGGAVELTKDADALIRALRKISGHDAIDDLDVTVQAMMFSWSPTSWYNANPPLQARIDALVAYGGAQSTPAGRTIEGSQLLAAIEADRARV